tara:strand:+ start:2310 stop:2753 length:444 start_codon:yes stop_codon:yes gene_type:complete
MKKTTTISILLVIIVLSGIITTTVLKFMDSHHSMEDMRSDFILQKQQIHSHLMPHGNYRCCLEKPCTYCIEKTPGHGEGAICDCLSDVVNGVHPCGECIGEILEGHGNPFLADYFAKAIAEKVGVHHIDTLKQIMFEKYEIPIEEQV